MYYVYLLKLKNKKYYTGSTPNIEKRFNEHQKSNCESTKNLMPVKLNWYCAFPNRLIARKFENYLKQESGQAFRNRHLVS